MIKKLWAWLRSLVVRGGEAVIDANALAIMEQQLKDAQGELDNSDSELAKIMAKRSTKVARSNELTAKLEEYGKHITTLLEKGNEELARKTSEQFATLEAELKTVTTEIATYDKHIANIKQRNKNAEQIISSTKTRIELLRTQEAAIKATSATSDAHSGAESSLASLLDTANKMERQQQERLAQIDAAAEIEAEKSGASLEQQLRDAGVIGGDASADDIMARFRK